MGSASREALMQARTALTPQIDTSAAAELLTAAAQIGSSPALISALGDPSASPSHKTRVLDQLFAGCSAHAQAVLKAAVCARWSTAEDLVAGIEELGLRAQAIVHSSLSEELLAVADVIDSDHQLQLSLRSKLGQSEKKLALVQQLFAHRASTGALAVLSHLVAHPRGRRLDATLRAFARIAADQRGTELATVTVATALTPTQQQRLASLLEHNTGRPVTVTTIIDPDLIGGIRIQLADDVLDGSVRARLDDLRQQLAA